MKLSDDGFNARRLRPKGSRQWGMRLLKAFAALLATLGILLAMAGVASLVGHPGALGELNASTGGAIALLLVGLVLLYLGVGLWRRLRRRMRRGSDLNMSPHLMKKHD